MRVYEYHGTDDYVNQPYRQVPLDALWDGFVGDTSTAAIPRYSAAKGWCKRLTWLLLTITVTIFLGYHFYTIVDRYRQMPVSIKKEIVQNYNMEFPAVTFCNMNPVKKTALKGSKELLSVMDNELPQANDEERKRRRRSIWLAESNKAQRNEFHIDRLSVEQDPDGQGIENLRKGLDDGFDQYHSGKQEGDWHLDENHNLLKIQEKDDTIDKKSSRVTNEIDDHLQVKGRERRSVDQTFVYFDHIENTDSPGNDFFPLANWVPSVSDCSELCIGLFPDCVGFTFVTDVTWLLATPSNCWVKDKLPASNRSSSTSVDLYIKKDDPTISGTDITPTESVIETTETTERDVTVEVEVSSSESAPTTETASDADTKTTAATTMTPKSTTVSTTVAPSETPSDNDTECPAVVPKCPCICEDTIKPPPPETIIIVAPPTPPPTPPPSTENSTAPERKVTTQEYQEQAVVTETLSTMPAEDKESLGYSSWEFIVDCVVEGVPCDPVLDFEQFYNPMHGNCYVFNTGWNRTHEPVVAHKTGRVHGLSVVINIAQDEYTDTIGGPAGARVVVHNAKSMPHPEEQGVLAKPGDLTSIGVVKCDIERLSEPYGDCIKPSPADAKRDVYADTFGVNYTRIGCFKTCYQKEVITKCGCYDASIPGQGQPYGNAKVPVCQNGNDAQEDCRFLISRKHRKGDLGCDAKCPSPCFDSFFKPTMSTSMWPSKVHLDKVVDSIASKIPNLIYYDSEKVYRENLLKVEVFFEEFNSEKTLEFASYPPESFASDVGGVLGLWLGWSVLTIFEFFELVVDFLVLIMAKAAGIRKKEKPSKLKHLRNSDLAEIYPAWVVTQSKGDFVPPSSAPMSTKFDFRPSRQGKGMVAAPSRGPQHTSRSSSIVPLVSPRVSPRDVVADVD